MNDPIPWRGAGAALAAMFCLWSPARAADPIGYTAADGVNTVPVTLAKPLPVNAAGSTGQDFSANAPALPVVGANFGATGPYANYVLIATAPALATRSDIEVQNTSGGPIAVLRDDGTAAAGAAPVAASVIALGGAATAGAQGGAWWSTTFKGRIQVYAPVATAQVTINAD